MKSHRVENHNEQGKEMMVDKEIIYSLMTAVAEQAVLDYKHKVEWLAQGKYRQRDSALDCINDYFCLREYFDSGCNGLVDKGKYSIAYAIDRRLMEEEHLDADKARYHANKMLNEIGKEYTQLWLIRRTRKLEKERNKNGKREYTD